MRSGETKHVVECPHCGVSYDHVANQQDRATVIDDARGRWFVQTTRCPTCENFRITIACVEINTSKSVTLTNEGPRASERVVEGKAKYQRVVYPFPASRPLPKEAPDYIRQDYNDAVATLEISPRASAACSRRCMQTIIRQHFKVSKRTLYAEIEELGKAGTLPTEIVESLHMVREFGNFGAHPIEGDSGLILDVEDGEAEFMIDLIDALIDQAFVRPAKLSAAKAALAAKRPKAKGTP
jgi:hypothetical protein